MKRLLDESDDALLLTMLDSAALDTPDEASVRTAARALGVASVAGGVLGFGAGRAAGPIAKLAAASTATKAAFVSLVLFAAAVLAWRSAPWSMRVADEPVSVRALPPVQAPPVPVVLSAPVSTTVVPSARRKPAPIVHDAPKLPRVERVLSLGAEVAVIDSARSAMAQGRPGDAVRILSAFANDFPHAVLAAEALVLGAEASLAAGDRAAAQHKANQYLGKYQGGAHAERASRIAHASR